MNRPFPAKRRILHRCLLAALFSTAVTGLHVYGQDVPLVSGAVGFLANRNGGQSVFQPVLAPVIAAPLGEHILVESRGELRNTWTENATGYPRAFTAGLQFLQADYIAHPRLVIVGGKFLTPFGSYNERLTPIWIPLFQELPLTLGIGTRTSGASNGGMLRGVALNNEHAQLNYTAYFSAGDNVHQFKAARTAGLQTAAYFPTKRLEVGFSYQRFLQQVHTNAYGVHVWWLPPRSAFELRSEYDHGARAQGYWIELAYRLSRFGGPDTLVGRFEPAFRMQQAFRNAPSFPGQADGLPGVDTQQIDFGFDYRLPHEFRLNSAYSRSFTTTRNKNLWDLSLTHRFLFPTWKGHPQ